MVDVLAFGEAAVIGGRRGASGGPAKFRSVWHAPRSDAVAHIETAVTQSGTLAVRGLMVPRHPFPPGAERMPVALLQAGPQGFVDTRYACRTDRDSAELPLTGPPPGIVSVGGYRFRQDELQDSASQSAAMPCLTALPDALTGHRLAGNATDRDTVRQALDALGRQSAGQRGVSAAPQGRAQPEPRR